MPGRFISQIGECATLNDPEKGLFIGRARRLVGLVANFSPPVSSVHGPAHLVFGNPVGDALVQAHDYIGAQTPLVGHGQFRPKPVLAAVDVRTEADAILVDLAQRAHAEGLVTAAVGENGPRPPHKAV